MKKKFKMSLTQKRAVVGLLFISPWLIGFLLFYLRSLLMTINFSLSTSEIIPGGGGYKLTYVGLENFAYAFTKHGTFNKVFTTSLGDMLIDVPLIIFFSVFMALLLNKKFKGRTLIRAIFFLPVILNSEAIQSAIALSAQMMSGGVSSVSSEIAADAGSGTNMMYYIDMFHTLGMPMSILDYVVAAVERLSGIITASGVQIVIFIAALQSVPTSLYEVAKIEGATGYETFWKVTFPMIMPLIITNLVYTVVDKFAGSDVVQLSYDTVFSELNYGLGSAMSLISTVAVCGILVVVVGWISKRTFYYN
jgi:ABC-type sugar transport system permease subunit